ncbi:hypothetical protein AVEN_13107-1 [Araneus ventricosus]|uniref:DUF4817 domain-containing protein n=1 Tax=Araneus ventricosus TaxID=182803 RepID=A0A4Y2KAY8_ARAVE|nr:hypothetical protein AVEN_13107-1 [Araneus ventricosus]
MFLSSPACLLIKLQLTTLGLRACFYTFSAGSDVNSRRFMKLLAPSRDRTTVQDFSRKFLFRQSCELYRQSQEWSPRSPHFTPSCQVCRKDYHVRETTLQFRYNMQITVARRKR